MSRLSPELLNDLIGDIYDCCIAPDQWPEALARLSLAVDAAYTAISLGDPRQRNAIPRMAAHSAWDTDRLRELNEGFGVEGVPGLKEVVLGAIDVPQSTLAQMSEADFHRTDFYLRWVKPQNLREACVTKFVDTVDRIGIMAQVTRDSRAVLGVEERRFIATLSPHIRRATMIGDLLDHQRVAVEVYRAALSNLATPIILTDGNNAIVFANPSAEQLLSKGTLITAKLGQVVCAYDLANTAIAQTLGSINHGGLDLGQRGNGIPISVPGSQPAVAYVLPLTGHGARAAFGEATAAIFISTASAVAPPPEAALIALFDLTQTEAKVLCRIGSGQDNTIIAAGMNISINTLKTHLQRIYSKTNIHRQTDLVKLVDGLGPRI
jgi:DNA-binding CsgD family transcriptional regulator/PAS domain-containing protein